jgi:predicted dehydrogenase
MKKLKTGLIGLGEVAQIIHLPVLEALDDRFEISALCDVSPGLLQWAGEQYRVQNLYQDANELVAQKDLDAVFVLNSSEFHAECAIAAALQGKHVLVEKPMVLTTADADALIAAKNKTGVQVMVGYMRRFAPAFTQAVEEVKTLEQINYAKIRDIIGPNHFFIGQTSNVRRFNDLPESANEKRRATSRRMIEQEIGDVPQEIKNVYNALCGLACHDLSAMRELIGMPRRVVSATQWNDGRFLLVTFEYDGFYATYEMVFDAQGRFDAHMEVFGQTKQLKVQYNTPYIRHLPTTLTICETKDDEFKESVIRPTFKDPYTVELEYFYDVVTKELPPKTSPEDYKEDLALFKMIIEALS